LKNLQGNETLEGEDEALDQGLLPELISRQTRVTHLAIFRLAEQALGGLGITPQQFALLVVVQRNPGSRQSLLAKARGLDKSTLVPMIDRLERDGYVERRALATDRRIKTIWITPRGEEVLERAVPLVRGLDDRIGAHLAPDERSELLRLMEKIRRGIEEH
jgi:DNA-binding MarR family transcriptional regulator